MEQIFRRIRNIAKSYTENISHSPIESDDDELRRIIDELNADSPEIPPQNALEQPRKTAPEVHISPEIADAFHILDLSENADIATIKSAYKAKIKMFHPDRVQNATQDVRLRAAEYTRKLNMAYNTLKKHRGF